MSPRRKPPDPWPWRADTPVERARRVAHGYREELARLAPDLCRRIDERCVRLGQSWVLPKVVAYHEDDLLTTDEVADVMGVQPGTVDQWRHRGMRDVSTPDGRRYLLRDVREYHAEKRRRRAGD